ncbi:S-adenosyl-L-methionine-dependent methyltransferase [Xylariaceae sp. FL0016]|nr:S-adenosyl-L-methionine-dependent methyltransferase [Xylariaceae sp. FL0016]
MVLFHLATPPPEELPSISSAEANTGFPTDDDSIDSATLTPTSTDDSTTSLEGRVNSTVQTLPPKYSTMSCNDMPPSQRHTHMANLARKISHGTAVVESHLVKNRIPIPGFHKTLLLDYPALPEHVARCRREVIEATQELHDLMVGPRENVRWMAWDFMGTQCLQLISHYKLVNLVPPQGIMLAELATKTPLDPVNLARILRYAMTRHIFSESSTGLVSHTASSLALRSDPSLAAWVGFNAEDIFPGAPRVLDALRRHPAATDPTQTGFAVAEGTAGAASMFAALGRDPPRARRMALAMASLTGGEGYEVRHFAEGYARHLDRLDRRRGGGILVDVGGSHGFACVELARRYRGMRFVVQDLPGTVGSAPRPVCGDDADVAARVRVQAHDFFTAQPVQGADVYFFRWIMHNYATPQAVRILQALVPALKPGARVVINDHCLRGQGMEEPWDEKLVRGMDLVMMTCLNAQERTEAEFRKLFELANKGFVFMGVTRPKDCRMSIIEAVWKPNDV